MKITAWSYSRYSDYQKCPKKSFFKIIQKLQEPSNPAMERGNTIHKLAENYIKGMNRLVPLELKKYASLFRILKESYKKKLTGTTVEETFAFTKDWVLTRWDDWPNCQVRIKIDCATMPDHETLKIYDWKTGKFRPEMNDDYMQQLELYVVGGFYKYKHIKQIVPKLVYLDLGKEHPEQDRVFKRKELPMLTKKWEQRVKPMLNDTVFAPRPSHECHWCHFRKSNGGPCQY